MQASRFVASVFGRVASPKRPMTGETPVPHLVIGFCPERDFPSVFFASLYVA